MVVHDLEVNYQCVTLPFATFSEEIVRLACLKHAASVHPEPGSNSQIKHSEEYLSGFVPALVNDYYRRIDVTIVHRTNVVIHYSYMSL